MDPAYQRFALADPMFYDDPSRRTSRRSTPYRPDPTRDWARWAHRADAFWSGWQPENAQLPEQGWKIHVSATPDTALSVLRLVSDYCHQQDLPFKHLLGPDELVAQNAKEADRASSGKFITIYPRDVAELRLTLDGLEARVGGLPGPYVLSDLRWKEGPLSVRYGAFVRASTRDDDGQEVHAVRHPDGHLVEDRREAAFIPPEWIELPPFLREQLDALGPDSAPEDFPYRITRVLHYSNAGGVYEAEAADGSPLVLKEARPFAGLTPDNRDAVTRLTDEEATLRTLAGTGVVPVRGALELHGHRFLVLDRIDGTSLNTEVVARSPIIRASATPLDRVDYRQWALGIAAQLDGVVDRIHAAGYAHGDLHPGNVMLTTDGTVVFVDFEMARPLADELPAVIGAPGFIAPDLRGALANDRYALACLKLFLFFPLTPLLGLDPLKLDDLLTAAGEAYALEDLWLTAIRNDIAASGDERLAGRSALAITADTAVRGWDTGSEDAILELQVLIGRSLTASSDFARADRMWPGDPQQFAENGFALAHGAAGVIHALETSSLDVDPQALDWLAAATDTEHASPKHLGLYDGLAGAAWLYRRQGSHDRAERILAHLRNIDFSHLGPDLYGGLPGVGLYLLSEAEQHPELMLDAIGIADQLRLAHDNRAPLDLSGQAPVARTGRAGLMWGPSGTALFALRLYEQTGSANHLRLAEDTLDYDLAHCLLAEDGSLQVNEGWRLMPYLATGSAGIGLVAAQLLPHTRQPDRYLAALDGINAAACAPFTIEPGLFQGRAGLIHYLVALARAGLSTPATDAALSRHVDALRLHAIRHGAGIAFPGQGLLRLSCDLATGSAGVLTALQAFSMLAYDDDRASWPDLLPFLLPTTSSLACQSAPDLARISPAHR